MSHRSSSRAPGERRVFLQAGSAALAGAAVLGRAHAAGSEEIKVGLVGCGGRGSGAANNAMQADKRVKITAVGDVFRDRVDGARKNLKEVGKEQFAVKDDQYFVGFDAFKNVIACDLDYVILATPPHFRAEHLAEAVRVGRHVFMEKPVAVDPVGCRSVIDSGKLAATKGLSIVAGTQRRHEKIYQDTFKRILDGAIGKIVAARCYWNQTQLWHKDRSPDWTPMEWMIRDWVNWRWLSGDHIVEQHVHNIDVINWFTSKDGGPNHPIRAVGSGGRAHRPTGDQYDYFAVDFEYADGLHSASYARQINGCDANVTETVIGDKGSTYTKSGLCQITSNGKQERLDGRRLKHPDPYVQEHIDLIDSIQNNKKLNEAATIATSTLTAIMGREAAYTGRVVTWDEMMKSNLKLGPAEYAMNIPLPKIDIPVPGRA